MYRTPEDALNRIRQLGFPSVFERIWKRTASRTLCRLYDPPSYFFDEFGGWFQLVPRFKTCLPLLQTNGDTMWALNEATGEYIEHCNEDTECLVVGASYQQFVASLLVDLGYAGLDDDIREIAPEFGFQHLDRLLEWYVAEDDGLEAHESKMRFVNTLT